MFREPTLLRLLRAPVFIAIGMLAGCAGSDGASSDTPPPASTGSPASLDDEAAASSLAASSATVPATSAAVSPDTNTPRCPAGEYPAFGAFELTTGALEWSTCSPEETYRSVVGASADLVLVTESHDQESKSIALDAETGAELWRMSTVRGLGVAPGPVDAQGVVVLETDAEGPSFVVGVDAQTGEERWRIPPGESVVGRSDDVVVVTLTQASSSGNSQDPPTNRLRGLDRATGTERWANDVYFDDRSQVGVERGAAALLGDTILVPTGGDSTAVDVTTGAILWTTPQLDHPSGADGVFVGPMGRDVLRAVDAGTGDDLWTAPGHLSYGDLLAVGEGMVVVYAGLEQLELVGYESAGGDDRWREEPDVYADPQFVIDGSVVLMWNGDLATVSASDGSLRWHLTEPLNSPLMNSVGTDGKSLFVAVNSLPWSD